MDLYDLLLAIGIVLAIWALVVLGLVIAGRGALAREVAAFLPNLALLFRGLLRDRRVRTRSKVLLVFALAWIASPIDLIPEFVPIAGPLDDAIIAALVLRFVLRDAGRAVVMEHWRGDPRVLDRLLGFAGAT